MVPNTINIILLVSVTTMMVSCGNKKRSENVNLFPAERIAVKIAPVESANTPGLVTATGLITTANEARYAFKIGGVIERIYVTEGQFFKKGQLLASLKITEIEAQLSQAMLAYEKTKRDYTRTANLYRDSVATLEQLQNSKTGVDIAAKTVDAVAFNKKFAHIYAAADGFVSKKLMNETEVVNPGIPVLAINETSGTTDWTLKLGVTDKEWAVINTGTTASVTIDAFPGKTFKGTVFRKSQTADPVSGSFQVELDLNLSGSRPAAGMFAKATINTETQKTFPSVPFDAVVEADGNNAFVFIPDGNNKVKKIPIVIESFTNSEVYVKSGLENVSNIIVSNSAFLNEKSSIYIIK